MSSSNHQQRVRNDNIAESKRMVADALEGMAGSIEAQDAAVKKIARITKSGVDDCRQLADSADDKAHAARAIAYKVERGLEEFRAQTVLQKFQWLFRGPWW